MSSDQGSTSTPFPRGLISRSGTPAGKARLPSIRTPRDLTLGGAAKRTFVPNIPARRDKKEEDKSESKSSHKDKSDKGKRRNDRGRGRGARGRGRGRGDDNIIQLHSLFEQGPSAATPKPGSSSGGSRGGGGGDGPSVGKAPVKLETSSESDKVLMDKLLRDDFIDDNYRDENEDLSPVKLPLADILKIEADENNEIRVKSEPMDTSPSKSNETKVFSEDDKQRTESPSIIMSKNILQPSEYFTNELKSEKGELIFLQLPDVLPGTPAYNGEDDNNGRKKSDTPASESKNKKNGSHLKDFSEGAIGKLQIYKSGKVKLMLGDIALDVTMGTPCSFLQELVNVQISPSNKTGEMTVLGQVQQRMVCIPDFEQLLGISSNENS